MSKLQSRKSVSLSGVLYDGLRTYCKKNNTTMSKFVEDNMREILKMPERLPPKPMLQNLKNVGAFNKAKEAKEAARKDSEEEAEKHKKLTKELEKAYSASKTKFTPFSVPQKVITKPVDRSAVIPVVAKIAVTSPVKSVIAGPVPVKSIPQDTTGLRPASSRLPPPPKVAINQFRKWEKDQEPKKEPEKKVVFMTDRKSTGNIVLF